jgi:hypothetical protein
MNTGNRGGSLHREGIYLMEVQDVEEKTSLNSGNDYLNIRYSVLRNGKPFGPSVWDIIVLNEASEWRWNQLMDALEAPEGVDIEAETWLKGKQVYARVVIDDYNDDDRNKVKAYLLPDRAEKMLSKESEGEQPLLSNDNGAKAKQRGRPSKVSAPELTEEESMPL